MIEIATDLNTFFGEITLATLVQLATAGLAMASALLVQPQSKWSVREDLAAISSSSLLAVTGLLAMLHFSIASTMHCLVMALALPALYWTASSFVRDVVIGPGVTNLGDEQFDRCVAVLRNRGSFAEMWWSAYLMVAAVMFACGWVGKIRTSQLCG
ncbi:MAG: hypothetical protein R3C03_15215 [Pirellulaceae bacterium]